MELPPLRRLGDAIRKRRDRGETEVARSKSWRTDCTATQRATGRDMTCFELCDALRAYLDASRTT